MSELLHRSWDATRREDHTIWTAVAPDAVFTVRT
jgi:hypothetical protein